MPDLADDALVLAGVNDFDSMCTGCHGAPGQEPEAVGRGLNPPAPDLTEEAAEMTPAELFWVTKNGIKMSGMPAWGVTHGDEAIWPVVAFMTKLPGMDESGYQELLAAAAGHGHHTANAGEAQHSHEKVGDSSGEGEHEHSVPAAEHSHDDAGVEVGTHEHPESGGHEEPVAEPQEHDHGTHKH